MLNVKSDALVVLTPQADDNKPHAVSSAPAIVIT